MNLRTKKLIPRKLGGFFRFLFLAFYFLITVFPFFWMVSTSVKATQAEIYAFPVIYWPEQPTFQNFINIAIKGNFLQYFANTFYYSVVGALGGTFVAILASYVLSRLRFKGRNVMLFLFLFTQMLPAFVGMAPQYQMMSKLGLINTRTGVIILYLCSVIPYSVVTLRSFFDNVPVTLEEAAMIDGCGRMRSMWNIAIPLMLPGIASTLIFDFVNLWNNLFTGILYLDSDHLKTVSVGLNAMIQKYDILWGELMAGTLIAVLPTMILFALLRKYMIAGLTSGAVKG